MTTQLVISNIEKLRELNAKTKSRYFAGSRLTSDLKRRKWFEKMSNVRSGFMLDLQEKADLAALQPVEEMQNAKESLEEWREKLPANHSESREKKLVEDLIAQEENVKETYAELAKEVGKDQTELFELLEKHQVKIDGYIEKLKSF